MQWVPSNRGDSSFALGGRTASLAGVYESSMDESGERSHRRATDAPQYKLIIQCVVCVPPRKCYIRSDTQRESLSSIDALNEWGSEKLRDLSGVGWEGVTWVKVNWRFGWLAGWLAIVVAEVQFVVVEHPGGKKKRRKNEKQASKPKRSKAVIARTRHRKSKAKQKEEHVVQEERVESKGT
jgi:hypothetical protein